MPLNVDWYSASKYEQLSLIEVAFINSSMSASKSGNQYSQSHGRKVVPV
jgi:hypothetical protein